MEEKIRVDREALTLSQNRLSPDKSSMYVVARFFIRLKPLNENGKRKAFLLSENLPLIVYLRNIGDVDILGEINVDTNSESHQGNAKIEKLEVGKEKEVEFSLNLKGEFGESPNADLLRIYDPNFKFKITTAGADKKPMAVHSEYEVFHVQMKHIIGDCQEWMPRYLDESKGIPPELANILLFGVAGAGKSSLFNAFLTCFEADLNTSAIVLDSAQHVTEGLTDHAMEDSSVLREFGCRFKVYDTKGLTEDNYLKKEFQTIVDQDMNAVIFVMPWSSIRKDDHMARLLLFCRCARSNSMEPIVVLTREDQIDPKDVQGIKQQWKDKLRAAFINPRDIYLVNLAAVERTHFERDRIFYSILLNALVKVDNYFFS